MPKSEKSEVKEIVCYKTSDGKTFESKNIAESHQSELIRIKKANALLDKGLSIGEILEAVNYTGDIDPILNKITKNTKLVIEYWQGSKNPGYQIISFENWLEMFVSGNVGGWGGSYGSMVGLRDLTRYATHINTDFGERI